MYSKLNCCINAPNDTFWAIAPERKRTNTEEAENKYSDYGGIRTHDLRNRSPVPLHCQRSYKDKWELIFGK